jgi:hypothetical protein
MLSLFSGMCFVFLTTFELWGFQHCLHRNANILKMGMTYESLACRLLEDLGGIGIKLELGGIAFVCEIGKLCILV